MTELPTTFGKYYLTDKLATGGMAEIFLGKLIGPGGFEKQLVIKQIHPALSGQRHFVDLFVAEAKTLVSLTHGNIVPVYELGVVDDTYFIAMEYIDGPTLFQLTEARLRRGGALAPALAGAITAEIARGLDYAHRKGVGVVHRDLSPRNVMLSREGEVKIVDFGIAVGHGAGEDRRLDDDTMPTGSFAYMSPEQVARGPLTGQSDLFSLGVLAWEMLAGARLFARPTPEETLAAVRAAPIPPPSSQRPDIPARLDELVLRALERDPARRWASAADLLAPLQRYLFSLDHTPGPREIAALVATTCPPAGRRPPTADGDGGTPRRAAPPDEAGGSAAPAAAIDDSAGPSTRPLAARTGRRRPPTMREATFATHVDLERALGKTPPPPAEDEPTTRAVARAAAPAPTTRPVESPAPAPTTRPTEGPAPASPPGSRPEPSASSTALITDGAAIARAGRRRRAPLIAVGAIALIAAALLLRRTCAGGDGAVTAGPADAAIDAAAAIDATRAVDASTTTAIDAADPTDAATASAITADAGPGRDGRRPTEDARRADPDARAPTASARLKVGADPWGEVYLDGRRLGRAPNAWSVPPGPHVVEVVFPSEDGELRRRFPIDVAAGGEARVFADFQATGSGR